MSNEVFPRLPGLEFGVRDTSIWKTQIKTTPSNREYRASDLVYPQATKVLQYEFLRSDDVWQEMQALVGFFNRHHGRLDSWLLDDEDDNTATDQVTGIGDGATLAFQLARSRGGFVQPIDFVNGEPVLTLSDWQGERVRLSPVARTNLLLRSENLANASWTKGGAGITGNASTGPDGVSLAADFVAEAATNSGHLVRQSIAFSPDQRFAFVVYAKAGTRSIIKLRLQRADFTSAASANFNLASGTVGLVNTFLGGSVHSVSMQTAGNGYYRCELVGQADSVPDASVLASMLIMQADVDSPIYLGDGTSGLTVFAAQVEQADYAGRYINTNAAAVTVPADYTLSPGTGKVTLSTAPAIGVPLRWSGQFYWRCRFERDELEVEKFLSDFWRAKQIAVRRVRA